LTLRAPRPADLTAISPDQEETLPQERDERWVYVALAILAVAYAVYAFRDSIDLSRLSFDWVRKLGGTASYALATVFAIFFQIWNKRRLERVRKKWEDGIRSEGQLRQGVGLKVAFTDGAKGSLTADLHLTRAALYLFDRGGRREPMRFPVTPSSPRDAVLGGVTLSREAGRGGRTVRIDVLGPSPFRIEFTTPEAEGWAADLGRAIGRSTRGASREAAGEREEAARE
jgi:hypothetical protein